MDEDIVALLRLLLLEVPAIVAMVDERIYPEDLPDAPTYPAIRIMKVSGVESYVLAGVTGIERARVQVDVVGDAGYSEVVGLKKLVRARLSGFRGGALGGNPCSIDSCKVITDVDMSVRETERSGPRLRRRMLEFEIWNREI